MAKFDVQYVAVQTAMVVNEWLATGDLQKKDWSYGAIRSFEIMCASVKLSSADAHFARQFCTGMRGQIDPVTSSVEFSK